MHILESMWSKALVKRLMKWYKFAHFLPVSLVQMKLARAHVLLHNSAMQCDNSYAALRFLISSYLF